MDNYGGTDDRNYLDLVTDIPEDRKEAEQEEKRRIAEILPQLQDLIDWFDVQAAACDSIAQARATADVYKTDIPTAIAAHDIVAKLLATKRDRFRSDMEAISRK